MLPPRGALCHPEEAASLHACILGLTIGNVLQRPQEIVFGLAEGKVKIGQLRSNKACLALR